MFVDIKEITRNKICLREYTGGGFLPTAKGYACAGYDAVALTQKGVYTPEAENILPVCEYKIGNPASTDGEFTLLGVGMTSDPELPDWESMIKTSSAKVCEAIRMIHQRNGYAILCGCISHRNIPDELLRLEGLDAIEVTNSERDETGEAAILCDMLAGMGKPLHIIASGEGFLGGVCVEAREADQLSIIRAMKAGRFYSSESDAEVHISQLPSGRVQVHCTPALRIEFFTNSSEENTRRFVGEDLVFAEYVPLESEKFVRAEITDGQGKRAWTNYIEVI